MIEEHAYPWYGIAQGDDLQQGDIFEMCPVFIPGEEVERGETLIPRFEVEDRDLILVSQSCDLVRGREKLEDVVLCSVWRMSEYESGYLASAKGRDEVRRGNAPGYHMLAACATAGMEREVRIVDFRQLYSLPLEFVRQQALRQNERPRLLPPYREHLSQAFARFFMRVGLPADIPPFK